MLYQTGHTKQLHPIKICVCRSLEDKSQKSLLTAVQILRFDITMQGSHFGCHTNILISE